MFNTSIWVFTYIFTILSASLGLQAPPPLSHTTSTVEPAPQIQPVTITLTGDIMLGRYVETLIDRRGWDNFVPYEIQETLAKSDLVYINLEGPVTTKRVCQANMCFSFRPDIVNKLHSFGSVVAGIANNHILDQGEQGYEDTKTHLKELNIPLAGNVRTSNHVYRTEINGQTFSFMGFADFELGSFDSFVDEVTKESTQTDILIVGLHAGPEYLLAPTAGQKQFARDLVKAGADVVSGHHPHVIQPFEIYDGKLIFYSLGNFIFDQFWSLETMRGLTTNLVFKKNQICVTPMLVKMNNQGLVSLNTALGDIEDRLFAMNPELRPNYQEKGHFCIEKE